MKDNIEIPRRIITALDVENKDQALFLIKKMAAAETFKVGLQLFSAEGPALLSAVKELGKGIFLDLKLHDIPNTVAGAVEACLDYGLRMMTLHASGGREMMVRAAETAREKAAQKGITRPLLLGVTVLTSLKDEQIHEVGMRGDTIGQVKRLAGLAWGSGLDGVVCSPQEIEIIRKEIGDEFLIVTPGIRPLWSTAQDQKRVMTPAEAIKKGADYLVIGRPIIKDKNPPRAFWKIVEEIEGQ